MTRNVCHNDKVVRVVLGIILLILAISINSWIFGGFAVYFLLTAFFSFCPINKAVNYNSCRIGNRKRKGASEV
ncbi:DUF2892 domain-containing protein [Cytophagaceae bacterium ABcell3]|nr:DUF2892 domain-containing protein [Cytophagaceae bacterium ABcell3]